MAYLLDTNILLRTISPNDPMHIETVAAIDILNAGREQVVIAPQNLIELWNVCTRPAEKNGLGFTPERTKIVDAVAPQALPTMSIIHRNK